ncbi:MAG: Smr/MutS family protein [Desulfovibrio sp.]|nr:Smr/MutS family protein [Desulfovibrio sp.]
MSDAFANHPFQTLAQEWHLTDHAKEQAKSAEKKRAAYLKQRAEAENEALLTSEDQAMFLRAVGRFASQAASVGGRPLQTLGEQCRELLGNGQKMGKKSQRNTAKIAKVSEENEGQKASESKKTDTKAQAVSAGQENADAWSTEKELRAFWKAMDGVEPLSEQRGRLVMPENQPQPATTVTCDFASLLEGRLEFQLFCRDEYLEGQITGLDQLIMDKLRGGSFSPEAHLDLHGFTVVQAFEALRGFIKSSWYKGLRSLLLIPGRGRNSLDGIGVLRSKLPQWLTQEPLKRVVLAFCTAQPADGGPGSIYVLLRKYRKKGRVFWDRLPLDEELF